MSIRARRLNLGDADLAVCIASLFTGNEVHAEDTARFLRSDRNVLVAGSVDGEPAGFVSGHLLERFKDHRLKFFIYEVGVLQKFRHIGVGAAMIECVLQTARDMGADTAFVLTNEANEPAVRLYTATGGTAVNSDDVMYVYDL